MKMREFNKNDWDCFSGCCSEKPMIGEDGDIIVIRDGFRVDVYYDFSDESTNYFRVFDNETEARYFVKHHLNEKTNELDLKLFNFKTF